MMIMTARARAVAAEAHDSINQVRVNVRPYKEHALAVSEKVAQFTDDQEVIAAAALHDVLEDVTPKNPRYDKNLINEVFGARVSSLVKEVTNAYTPEHFPLLNRKSRKTLENCRLASSSEEAILIKLADIWHNTKDIDKERPDFSSVYIQEKIDFLYLIEERIKASLNAKLRDLFYQVKNLLKIKSEIIHFDNPRIKKAVEIAAQYSQIDGGHHKAWAIDQMVRALLGKDYEKFVKKYENNGEYEWSTGIAP